MNLLFQTRLLTYLLEHTDIWVSQEQFANYFDEIEGIMEDMFQKGQLNVRSFSGNTYYQYQEPNCLEMLDVH